MHLFSRYYLSLCISLNSFSDETLRTRASLGPKTMSVISVGKLCILAEFESQPHGLESQAGFWPGLNPSCMDASHRQSFSQVQVPSRVLAGFKSGLMDLSPKLNFHWYQVLACGFKSQSEVNSFKARPQDPMGLLGRGAFLFNLHDLPWGPKGNSNSC